MPSIPPAVESLDALERPRPPPSPFDVSITIRRFALLTYAVDPARVQRHLPATLEAERFDLGPERAFVSAVAFVNDGLRFGFAPWARLRVPQVNLRAYVRRGDERAVWFFATALGSRWVAVPRRLWRLPWSLARIGIDASDSDGRTAGYRLRATTALGSVELDAEGTDEPAGRLPGFADDVETAGVLTHPVRGYYRRSDGRLARLDVWHRRMEAFRARPTHARVEPFERLGIVSTGEPPHSVLLCRDFDLRVILPPHVHRELPRAPA